MNAQERGQAGESAAATFLQNRGFRLLGRNLRRIGGEIDLLMQDGDEIVVVEVKSLATTAKGIDPLAKIGPVKTRILWRLAGAISAEYPDHTVRIDACAVSWDTAGVPTIAHYPSILDSWQ